MAKTKTVEESRHADDLAERLFPYRGDEFSESVMALPPELRRLHTETYDFSISTIFDQIKDGRIFIPEFQRNYVWSLAQASRLIESLIIQCPIPVIYLNQEADEKLSVIDGNQRLTSITYYLENRFDLVGLTAYPELLNKRFFDLDPRFQRHITNRTLRCIVVMKDTHPQVKFDVFERLNTGAAKLTPQELRHGLYHGPFMKLIKHLAAYKPFLELLDVKKSKRMRTDELVLRFLALSERVEDYQKPLSAFLNNFAKDNQRIGTETSEEYTNLFETTVEDVRRIFGEYAFKLFDKDLKVTSQFNTALYDAQMVAVSRLKPSQVPDWKTPRESFIKSFAAIQESDAFTRYTERATSDETSIKGRVKLIDQFLQKAL